MANVAYDFSVEADVGAESILAAATDFSARRLKLWPGITAARYRVLHSGDKWAEVVEGTGPFWSRERYEWATPGLVTATQLDSNVAVPGGLWQMRVVARGDGG